MLSLDKHYVVSGTGVMTEAGTVVGSSWTMGPNGGASDNTTLGPELPGQLLRSWALVVEQDGGAFNGIVRVYYKLDDGDAWTSYRSVPTDDLVGARVHHKSAAGFHENTGQTWLSVSAIKIVPVRAGNNAANTACHVFFRAEYAQ